MHLRTPKRYTRRGQRRRPFSLRRLWLWILAPIVIFVGIGIYQTRLFVPEVTAFVENIVGNVESHMATAGAPTVTPTEDPRDKIEQADAAWRIGSIDQAVRLYQDVMDSIPNDVTAHYRVTLGLIMQGRLEEAMKAAETTVNADPFSSDAWAIHAWTLDWNGRSGEAIASALMALELNPDSARARAFLAEAFFSLNLTQRALDKVNEALEIDPDSVEAYRARGLIERLGLYDFEAARADFQTAYDLAPNMIYVAVDLAQMDAGDQNYTDAVDRMKDVIELNPENTQALYWLGYFYFTGLGDPSQAADYLTRCVQYNPDSIGCNYILGRSQYNLEQISAAEDSFRRAIELGSTNPYHYWWAGRALVAQGNCSGALTYLRPGYDIAIADGNETLVSDYEAILSDCQFSVGRATPTAEVEGENTDGS